MSDNYRRYRAIVASLRELHGHPTGRMAQHILVLAIFIGGIVGSKSTHIRQVAKKGPPVAKVGSRIKRVERWYQNEGVSYEIHYLPVIEALLASLAKQTLVLSMDASDVGRGCMVLMVNLIYQKRAIPLVWVVFDRPKGHSPAQDHIELLQKVEQLLPAQASVVFLGDGEFDSVELQTYLGHTGWEYVCRTAKNTLVFVEDAWVALQDFLLQPGMRFGLHDVLFTEQAFPVTQVVLWWDRDEKEPLYLVTNLELTAEACHLYRRRMRIETFFSDQKSRGFNIHKSHIADPKRLARILIAACLAYIWMIYLGVSAHQDNWVPVIHRPDRCDLSLFQLGLDLLDHFLNEGLAIDVGFNLHPDFMFA